MTQIIEISRTKADQLVTPFSRYLNQDVIIYGEAKFVTFNIYKRVEFIPDGSEKSMLITKGVEYRPDLVSFDIYGIVDFWWRILEANNIKDVFDFISGRTIILPTDPTL